MSFKKVDSAFGQLLKQAKAAGRPVILDGALGTELDNRGMQTDSALWSGLASLSYPELLAEIHEDYVAAGAEVLTTSTFRTTERAFARALEPVNPWQEAVRKAVSIARRASQQKALVAGSVAPLEDCFRPDLAPSGKDAEQAHGLLCRELVQAGVDALLLETFGALKELGPAINAAKSAGETKGVPFIVSVTTNAQGALISGDPIKDAWALARDSGALAFSINCIPFPYVDTALSTVLPSPDMPIGAYANLGVAEPTQDWQGSASLTPSAYAERAATWFDAGVSLIGGCCGSTPKHINALAKRFKPLV